MKIKCPRCGEEMICPADEDLSKYGLDKISSSAPQVYICSKCLKKPWFDVRVKKVLNMSKTTRERPEMWKPSETTEKCPKCGGVVRVTTYPHHGVCQCCGIKWW